MPNPLVTVLIPVLNGERYLRESLASVQAQTYEAVEILVIDDGSTDGTAAILAEIAAADPRIRVVGQANGGISAALNAGLAEARGELIARTDADDIMLPHRVARQAAFLADHPEAGFCASHMEIVDADGRFVRSYRPPPHSRPELDAMIEREELITYTHPTVMFRTALARRLGGYRSACEPSEDTELFGRMIAAGAPGFVIPEVLMRYRMHEGSISGSKALRQVGVTEMVRTNFYRRIKGMEEIEPGRWQAHIDALPWALRLKHMADMRSLALRQAAVYKLAAGNRAGAGLLLAGSLALRPRRIFRAGIRRLQKLLSLRRSAPAAAKTATEPRQ